MKAILISIRPRHTCNILNGIKLWEIRKKFPKDYVGWVYIYATKDGRYFLDQYDEPNDNSWVCWDYTKETFVGEKKNGKFGKLAPDEVKSFNGKVVARFWCDKVEEYVNGHKWSWKVGAPMWGACNDYEYILKDTCLTEDELYDYCEDLSFKAIHITKLEIFDKPKEISEFMKTLDNFDGMNCFRCSKRHNCLFNRDKKCEKLKLTRAPQSWQFIEI